MENLSMTTFRLGCLVGLSLLGWAGTAAAEPAPSYARHVRPFLARYCVECHNANEFKGGLAVDTFEALLEGGTGGAGFVAGKADQSRLVLLVEGKGKPLMPPARSKPPSRQEGAVLR